MHNLKHSDSTGSSKTALDTKKIKTLEAQSKNHREEILRLISALRNSLENEMLYIRMFKNLVDVTDGIEVKEDNWRNQETSGNIFLCNTISCVKSNKGKLKVNET